MIVYKVVYSKGTNIFESSNRYLNGIYKLEYYLNKTTRPNHIGSKIFAFKNLEDAKNWKKEWSWYSQLNIVILKCETPKYSVPKINNVPSFHSPSQFWKAKLKHKSTKKHLAIGNLPHGTVWCDEVTPIEMVL